MNSKSLLMAILFLVATAGAVWYFAMERNNDSASQDQIAATSTAPTEESSPADKRPYSELMGDDYDEAYLASMLAHHEGAVNMSEQAQAATARPEIRELAGNITSMQSREMAEMRDWQEKWGYDITNSAGHMSHGGSGTDMAGDMVEMQNRLNGLTGEDFDREFLKQMILHHQQAIDMSMDADTNAKHQEIKELAKNVINDQSKEIEQMRTWQEQWGY